jgi:hypothetical protein
MADQYIGGLRVTEDGALYVDGGYNPASVAITGGTINGATIGGTTPAAGTFTTLTSTGIAVLNSNTFAVSGGGSTPTFSSFSWNGGAIGWSSAATATGASTLDLTLWRDAADTLALKRGTNAQVFNHYGSEITAGTRYSRLAIKHATTTLSGVTGATVTATSLIPAKANVLGVNTVVTTALGTGSGTTGYTVGDGADADRWGAVTGTIAGTDTDGTNATADPTGWFTAANNVVITAAGGNFDGTGAILVDVAYTITEAD